MQHEPTTTQDIALHTDTNTEAIAQHKPSFKRCGAWLAGVSVLMAILLHLQVRLHPVEVKLVATSKSPSCHLDAGLGSKVQPWLLWCR